MVQKSRESMRLKISHLGTFKLAGGELDPLRRQHKHLWASFNTLFPPQDVVYLSQKLLHII
jgi:hypothetical protein